MNGSLWKRVIDIIVSMLALILLAPILVVIAILIRFSTPGPAIFKQERLGNNGISFTVYKFRTMVDKAPDGAVTDSRHDSRVTRIGSFLRAWSLDELPQLVNVLRGEMSIVGPRPDRTFRLSEYTEEQRQRLRVKPGITGLAQINGRNNIPWEERYELDVEYVNNWSLWLDFYIMLRTVRVVLVREGIDHEQVGG